MNGTPPKLRDADLVLVGVALQRAARQAQQLAQTTATPCYVWQNGKIVNIGAPAKLPPAPQA
jgi:hypothetical protein